MQKKMLEVSQINANGSVMVVMKAVTYAFEEKLLSLRKTTKACKQENSVLESEKAKLRAEAVGWKSEVTRLSSECAVKTAEVDKLSTDLERTKAELQKQLGAQQSDGNEDIVFETEFLPPTNKYAQSTQKRGIGSKKVIRNN